MKTIIAGSRDIKDPIKAVEQAVRESGFFPDMTEIVSGTAARVYGLPIKRFPADWKAFGKSAGFIRNRLMAEYADALIAVWDGQSRGTQHMIATAKAVGIKVYVHYVKEGESGE